MWGAQYRALQLDITPPTTAGQLFDEEMGRKRQFEKEAESKAFRFKGLNTTFAEELAQLRKALRNGYNHSVYKDIEAHTKGIREVEANILENEQLVERIRHLMKLEYRIFFIGSCFTSKGALSSPMKDRTLLARCSLMALQLKWLFILAPK